jgi:hypothetical protein
MRSWDKRARQACLGACSEACEDFFLTDVSFTFLQLKVLCDQRPSE